MVDPHHVKRLVNFGNNDLILFRDLRCIGKPWGDWQAAATVEGPLAICKYRN